MRNMAFTVIIPTFNRVELVTRAVRSVLDQNFPDTEIIVVDDASTDATPETISRLYPQVRYLRQETNQGPGPARNRGIAESTRPFLVMLDDDDTLRAQALEQVAALLDSSGDLARFPVFQFASNIGTIPEPFLLIRLNHYLRGVIIGDFTPVIQAKRFRELGLAYPHLRIGAEHLLWWRIAEDCGIPTWTTQIVTVHSDSSTRITSPQQQIAHAREHAEAQELTLDQFGEAMKIDAPSLYCRNRLGAATYWILANERRRAREHLNRRFAGRYALYAAVLWGSSWLPRQLFQRLFRLFRRLGAS